MAPTGRPTARPTGSKLAPPAKRLDRALDRLGGWLANRVRAEPNPETTPVHTDIIRLARILQPGDVLLVDGRDKVSAAIRYLTQSSWSHAAMYVGDALAQRRTSGSPNGAATDPGLTVAEPHTLDEMNVGEGCVSAPLAKYAYHPTRICRPVMLRPEDRAAVVRYMIDRIGLKYDNRNVFDLARFLIPHPPVPVRWRRQMLALGSGEPTRAICSTLIAQAFHSVRYPILPRVERLIEGGGGANGYTVREILHIRHHSLFAPRDFDVSPYFEIVKPTIAEGFDYKAVTLGAAIDEWKPPTAPVALLRGEDGGTG